MEYNIGTVYPPFCKFNILSIPPHAHVLERRIDPDGLALFLLRRPVNRKPCETIPETLRYWKKCCRHSFLISVLKARAVSILQGLLISCNQMSAEYLFMTDKLYDVRFDTGDKVIQCGRHNDIFKLWLQWRAKVQNPLHCHRKPILCFLIKRRLGILLSNTLQTVLSQCDLNCEGMNPLFYYQGTEGFEKHMDRLMELSEYMVRRIKQMPDKYYLILEPELVNVCFWYLPTRVRNMPHTAERIKILGEVCFISLRTYEIQTTNRDLIEFINIVRKFQKFLSRKFQNKRELLMLLDMSNSERSHDASWHADGWLPAGRSTAQLLQEYYLQCRCNGGRHRLPPG